MDQGEKIQQVEVQDKLFIDINPENPVTEIESFCVNCEKNGITRILLTKIPFFKEVVIMAFDCPHCGNRNSEVQSGGSIADQGIHFELKVCNQKVKLLLTLQDLNRRIIKSEHATIKVPEIDLEIPRNTQKGKLTTVEGFLSTARDQLGQAVSEGIYDSLEPEHKAKIESLVKKLDDIVNLKTLPINFILDDPSGNSFIENPFAPHSDPYIKVQYYDRTKEMCEEMGFSFHPEYNEGTINVDRNTPIDSENKPHTFVNPNYYDRKKEFTVYKSKSEISAHLMDFTRSINTDGEGDIKQEALKFLTDCYCCGVPGENLMCICSIPFFKEIIITCFKCQACGFKTTDVKGGGGMSEKATKLTLKIKSPQDLNRDCFKSESARLVIPELEFETDTGSMGSMFTTIEGLVEKLINSLDNIPFSHGDSNISNNFEKFLNQLRDLISEPYPEFTIILDDPLSNCFIASPVEDPSSDVNLIKEEYERTWEQNEDLGINDMKVDNYENEAQQAEEVIEEKEEESQETPNVTRGRGG